MRFGCCAVVVMLWGVVACAGGAGVDEPVVVEQESVGGMGGADGAGDGGDAGDWLSRIEVRAQTIQTLAAELRYDRIQGLVGDRQRRFGKLVYQAGPPSRFAVHFDRVLVDERLDRQDRWYIFDGEWLVERHGDQKLFIKRQVRAPGAEGGAGGAGDPLALGEGPIPLPISQKKDAVLKRFDVRVIEAVAGDPVDAVHLHLTPKAGGVGGAGGAGDPYVSVDLWYGRQTLLPVRVRTVDDSENESVIDVSDVVVNEPVDAAVLSTAEPTEPGWQVQVTPWEGGG